MFASPALRLRAAIGILAILLQLPCFAQSSDAETAGGECNGNPVKLRGHLFILSGQSNMTGKLEEGFTATVRKGLGASQVTVVRKMKSGRGIRFWVEDYALPENHELAGKLKSGNGSEDPLLLQAVKFTSPTIK